MNPRSVHLGWLYIAVFIFAAPSVRAQRDDFGQRRGIGGSFVITGRVLLPSGGPADSGVKVTLRNTTLPLSTLPTDRNGEFKFINLGEGTYFVEVVGDRKLYEPVTQEVELVRGRSANLTIYLKARSEVRDAKARDRSVSLAELDQKIPPAARRVYEKSLNHAAEGQTEAAVGRVKEALAI